MPNNHESTRQPGHATLAPRYQPQPATLSRLTSRLTIPRVMLLIFTALFGAHLFMAPATALAGEFDDLQSSAQTDDITAQERQHFTDAPDQFPKHWVSDQSGPGYVAHWLDDERVVFSTYYYPGWQGRYNEPERVIALHIDSGKVSYPGYRGALQCLNHKGDLMIRFSPEPRPGVDDPKNDHWLVGTWGKSLKKIKWEQNSFVPSYLCRFASYGNPIYNVRAKGLHIPPDAHRIKPLLPEHGVLKESIDYENHPVFNPLSLIKPDGSEVPLQMVAPVAKDFTYQPWQGTYFNTRVADNFALTLHPSGDITHHRPPNLIRFWAKAKISKATAYKTRAGMLWAVSTVSKRWGKQGLFLETAEGLLKIDAGRSLGAIVSPNGCRVWSPIVHNDSSKPAPQLVRHIVIDLCQSGAKP